MKHHSSPTETKQASQKGTRPAAEISIAILCKQERIWIQRRSGTSHLDGFWEFPGGRIEAGESPAEAAIREVQEEAGFRIESDSIQYIRTDLHQYPDRLLRLHFFLCSVADEPGQLIAEGRWIHFREIAGYRMPAANRPVIEWLLKRFDRRQVTQTLL